MTVNESLYCTWLSFKFNITVWPLVLCCTAHIHIVTHYVNSGRFSPPPLSALYLKLTRISLPLPCSVHKLQEDVDLEVLHSSQEHSPSNAVLQPTHNPWSLKCQQHLQRMKEDAKHCTQPRILSLATSTLL